eukprot:COSAG05_NODE_18222_length_311_cov_2.174528_2_plen_54_part_01
METAAVRAQARKQSSDSARDGIGGGTVILPTVMNAKDRWVGETLTEIGIWSLAM